MLIMETIHIFNKIHYEIIYIKPKFIYAANDTEGSENIANHKTYKKPITAKNIKEKS